MKRHLAVRARELGHVDAAAQLEEEAARLDAQLASFAGFGPGASV